MASSGFALSTTGTTGVVGAVDVGRVGLTLSAWMTLAVVVVGVWPSADLFAALMLRR